MRVAVLTLKHRFGHRFLRMYGHVFLHRRFLEEGFIAQRALVDGSWMFQQLVLFQFVDVGAFGITVGARQIRLFTGVRTPVTIIALLFLPSNRSHRFMILQNSVSPVKIDQFTSFSYLIRIQIESGFHLYINGALI